MANVDWQLQPITGAGVVEPDVGYRIRYIGGTAPSTTGWAVNDLWLDTSTETSSVAPKMRRWTGSAFSPAS